jgi:hypothetical protein
MPGGRAVVIICLSTFQEFLEGHVVRICMDSWFLHIDTRFKSQITSDLLLLLFIIQKIDGSDTNHLGIYFVDHFGS